MPVTLRYFLCRIQLTGNRSAKFLIYKIQTARCVNISTEQLDEGIISQR